MESFEQVVLALEVAAWGVSGTEQEYPLPKAKVIHVECGHQMDGWPLCARLSTLLEISLESNSVQTPSDGTKPRPPPPSHMHAKNIKYAC